MAENTYKKTPKKKKKEKLPSLKKPKDLMPDFLQDRRFHLILGFSLVFIAVFLLISFISYLFTGKADQSVVGALTDTALIDSGKEVSNYLGVTGAMVSHYFIFKWFGLASFLVPVFFFSLGYKILFGKEVLPIERTFYFCFFFLFWGSTLMGFFMTSSDEITELGYLSGGIGYSIALVFDSLLGWGIVLFLTFSLIVFIIYFFNQTTFNLNLPTFGLSEEGHFTDKEIENSKLDHEDKKVGTSNELADILDQVKVEVALEDNGITPEDNEQVESIDDTPSELELSIPSDAKKKKKSTGDLDIGFDIENTLESDAIEAQEDEKIGLDITKTASEKLTDEIGNYDPTLDLGTYQYPGLDLLIEYPINKGRVTKEELELNKDKIVETLINFKIGISSIKATIGPTVTLYEIVPDAGVKISKIKNLEDDIALSLAALGIRIIAPIPGKGTIGIEVPNKNREMVDCKSVFATEKFMKSNMALPIALGRTISNEVFVTDLAKMPHLLMAGATGQGKSVGLNIILASLLYKKHPSQLKFVLVDPKKVELTLFNKIERHYLAKLPDAEEAIITDTKKVVYTLNSLCIEMDRRYDLLKDANCRNLKEYNVKFVERRLNPEKGHRYLPYIVLVIDELADLMMTAGKEVETPIARLAQLARAIGIHLVVATQRPSVNVITGIIKANFPARLSFRVTSKIDSRTILDAGGADQLIGMGDMLLSLGSDLVRLQCAFVDTPEVERICDFIGEQRGYPDAYILPEFVGDDDSGSAGEVDLSDRDVLFDEAARLIVAHQQGSTSLIQRKMKLGYNRAGRIIDQLEAAGVVGAFEGSKAREVLVHDEHSLEQLLSAL